MQINKYILHDTYLNVNDENDSSIAYNNMKAQNSDAYEGEKEPKTGMQNVIQYTIWNTSEAISPLAPNKLEANFQINMSTRNRFVRVGKPWMLLCFFGSRTIQWINLEQVSNKLNKTRVC